MRNEVIVDKLIRYSEKVIRYCDGLSYEDFRANEQCVEACVFNLSQMGELSNQVDKEFAAVHSDIPWRILYGLRNRIVHDYEGVNLQLIWQIISDDIPVLLEQLRSI